MLFDHLVAHADERERESPKDRRDRQGGHGTEYGVLRFHGLPFSNGRKITSRFGRGCHAFVLESMVRTHAFEYESMAPKSLNPKSGSYSPSVAKRHSWANPNRVGRASVSHAAAGITIDVVSQPAFNANSVETGGDGTVGEQSNGSNGSPNGGTEPGTRPVNSSNSSGVAKPSASP